MSDLDIPFIPFLFKRGTPSPLRTRSPSSERGTPSPLRTRSPSDERFGDTDQNKRFFTDNWKKQLAVLLDKLPSPYDKRSFIFGSSGFETVEQNHEKCYNLVPLAPKKPEFEETRGYNETFKEYYRKYEQVPPDTNEKNYQLRPNSPMVRATGEKERSRVRPPINYQRAVWKKLFNISLVGL